MFISASMSNHQINQINTSVLNSLCRYSVQLSQVNVSINSDDVSSITDPANAVFRNALLAGILGDSPTIVDAFACVGFDTMSFVYSFPNSRVFSAQITSTAEEAARYNNLTRNTDLICTVNRVDRMRCVSFGGDVGTFLSGFGESIDLLYADPPWSIAGKKLELQDMLGFLRDTIVSKTDLARIGVICVKTDFAWDREFDALWKELTGGVFTKYISIRNQPGNGIYFFHIFTNVQRGLAAVADVECELKRFRHY